MLTNHNNELQKGTNFGFGRQLIRFFQPFVVVFFRQLIVDHYSLQVNSSY